MPVEAGILLNSRFGVLVERHKAVLRSFDQIIILLIGFTAFCESFAEGIFRSYEPADIVKLRAGMMGLYLLVFALTWGLGRALKFPQADTIVLNTWLLLADYLKWAALP